MIFFLTPLLFYCFSLFFLMHKVMHRTPARAVYALKYALNIIDDHLT